MKELRVKENNKEYIAKVSLVDVKGVNTDNVEGVFPVLKIKTFLLVDGKLDSNKGVKFPNNTEIGEAVNLLAKSGMNYQYGTDRQCELLKEYGYDDNEKIIRNIMTCIRILKENNMAVDNGVEFGKRPFIAKLHESIIDTYNAI